MSEELEPTEEVESSAPVVEEPVDHEEDEVAERLAEYIEERKAAQAEEESEEDCEDGDCEEEEGESYEEYEESEMDEELEDLAVRAAEVGLTESDIEDLGTVEALERTVRILEGRGAGSEERQQVEGIDLDNVPDELKPVLEQMDKQYRARIEGLESQLGQYNSFLDNQAEKAVVNEFDSFVSDLGPGFESLLGTGSTESLSDDSGALTRRVQVLEEMNVLANGYEAAGRAVPDEQTLFTRALNGLFADDVAAAKQASTESTVAQRRGKFVSRPTQKNGKPQSPEAAARASVRKYMEEAGIGFGGEE